MPHSVDGMCQSATHGVADEKLGIGSSEHASSRPAPQWYQPVEARPLPPPPPQARFNPVYYRIVSKALYFSYQAGDDMISSLDLATVTSRGQITLPSPIRKKLGISKGSKVVFLEDQGRIFVENANMLQLKDRSMDFTTEEFIEFSGQQMTKLDEDDAW
jgi:AbrB family looped-hinge helix DNA binding protein